MYLTYTIWANYHNTTEVAYCAPYLHKLLRISKYYCGSIFCTLPTQYAPNIILILRLHIVYLTYTICSNYQNTSEVAYCVPYLHNMPPLSRYYQGSILCTLPTQLLTLPKCYQGSILVSYLHNMLRLSYYYPIIILPR